MLLRDWDLAEFAGVHLYTRDPVVMAADSRLLMFHNGTEKPVALKVALPESVKSVIDAFSGEKVSDGGSMVLKIDNPGTRVLLIE